jgi:hypothetical protein
MHSERGGQSAALINRIARLDVTLQQDQPSFGATELRPRNPIPYGLEPLSSWFQRLEARLRGAAAPAACCGSGQWRRVGSPLCRTARRLFRSRLSRAVAHRLE